MCGTESFVPGSLEGGMGYWMYSLETPNVKWMAPAATNANYEVFGGTFLADRKQDCTALGGAVRVSNRLLVPNDYFEFEGGANADGFLGYMLSRTPLGKRSPTDEANTWTVVVDAANYKGPVVFTSSWFWDMRVNWHPQSTSCGLRPAGRGRGSNHMRRESVRRCLGEIETCAFGPVKR